MLADHKLTLLGQLAIIVGLIVAFDYSPFSNGYCKSWGIAAAVALGLLLSAFYWLFLVRRFGRCEVEWADYTLHMGEEAATAEKPAAVWKSRGLLCAFIIALGIIIWVYSILGFGLAPYRIYNNHKAQLDKLVELRQKYDKMDVYEREGKVFAFGNIESEYYPEKKLSEEGRETLIEIFKSLRPEYVFYIGIENNRLLVDLYSKSRSVDLVWKKEVKESDNVIDHRDKTGGLGDGWWLY
jgi:hypothetical protein